MGFLKAGFAGCVAFTALVATAGGSDAQKPIDTRDIWKLGCAAGSAQSQATCQLRNNLYAANGQLIARLILGVSN